MLAVFGWWLILLLLGLVALPLTLRLFRFLPDRGYAFARPLGLLLTGYVLWLGGSLGLLSNGRLAMMGIIALLAAVSLWIWRRDGAELRQFLRDNRGLILATELVFLLAFAGWALVRAYNPEISATEKPMEIAFLNAILRSERFPPNDPWLSGYGISYYYFGYLLISVLTRLSGVAASVAFNLAIALLFALAATGSFSIVYNLVRTEQGSRVVKRVSAVLWALLGPLFVVVVGNLEGVFEVLHTRGLGSAAFWKWLDINNLAEAAVSGQWVPQDMWWWWRASRVVNDRDLYGTHMEVIDEFPQFSFLLGDMHPHVLALPFVLLTLALALNVLLGAASWWQQRSDQASAVRTGSRRRKAASAEEALAQVSAPVSESTLSRARRWLGSVWDYGWFLLRQRTFDIGLLAFGLGALGFLNTWDLPIHLFVICGAFLVGQRALRNEQWLGHTIGFTGALLVPAVLLYLPFYLGFQSQAGGVLPVLFNVTRVHQYLLMFGLFVFVLVTLTLCELKGLFARSSAEERRFLPLDLLQWFAWFILGPVLLILASVALVLATKNGREFIQGVLADQRVQSLIGSQGVLGLLRQSVLLRLGNPWVFVLTAGTLAVLVLLLERSWRGEHQEGESTPALHFSYLMAGTGFLLTLAVEFVYLRDSFGTRMNTVFKFYYQAWLLFALASAYGCYHLLGRPSIAPSTGKTVARGVWAAALVLLISASLVYPLLGVPSKAGDFKGKPTLDGMAFIEGFRADDYAAMLWLQKNVSGSAHIVESTGGSYTETAWVSAFTGLPTVLGWDFHEHQWRGNSTEANLRRPLIEQIYQGTDREQVLSILDKYDIEYVYLGPVERSKFNLPPNVDERLGRFLDKVFEQGSVSIYRR
ncbi:MAG TPA: DUF2298 domain-containing protein [Anaerolineae bacterium]|nr:DUF2298 domain-containing protein [Anaerolineae bacterium]